jgi:uncharacterized tellurite resistance protein B-like protein
MILGILGAIITILILLNRLANAGIDLGGLNPFLWQRRRNWKQKLEGNPIYQIDNSMDVVALYMVAVVKADGDITKEDKDVILKLFETDFHLSPKEASSLLVSSSHLLANGEEAQENVAKVFEQSLPTFTEVQIKSSQALIRKAAGDLSARPPAAHKIIHDVEKAFKSLNKTQDW